MIAHHLSEDLLLAYSSGTATRGTAVMVACHLTLCPVCRHRLDGLEAVHAAMADDEPADLDLDALLAGTLGQLDQPTPPPPCFDKDGILPSALAELVGDFSSLPWRRVFPQVQEIELDLPGDGMPIRLFSLAAGSRVPDHAHQGLETSLVFAGGFSDDGGHFGRGDVAIRDDRQVHRQRIDPGEPCVVLVVADNPLIPKTLRGWAASKIRSF